MARRRATTTPQPEMPPDEPLYPSMDDDEAEADAAGMADHYNATNRVDLSEHEPAPIGAGFGVPSPMGMDGGFGAPQVVGRPVAPKIWANAHLFPAVTQLRVWKVINGNHVLVGTIDAQANEEDFIQEFIDDMPVAGEAPARFVVRPLDNQGREVREEMSIPPISPTHTILKRMRAAKSANAPAQPAYGYGYGGGSPDPLMLRLMDTLEKRASLVEEEAKAQRERLMSERELLAQREAELAGRSAMATEAVTERLMKAESERADRLLRMEAERAERSAEQERTRADRMAELERLRNEQSQTAMTSIFSQMAMMQQQAAERERDAYERRMRDEEARRERERVELEDRRMRERMEWEQKWERERSEASLKIERERIEAERRERERESERTRQHDQKMREMELAAQREREHAERMMAINNNRDKTESVEGLLERGAKMLNMFGMKPTDLMEKVLGGDKEDDSGSGTSELLETLGKVVATGISTVGEVMKARANAGAPGRPPGPMPGAPMLPAYMPQGYPGMAPQGAPMPVGAQPPGDYGAAAFPAEAAPAAAQPQAPAEPQPPQSSLPLATQRDARFAIRDLIKRLRALPDTEWQEAVALAIAGEVAIYHYCKDVTIRAALAEGGGDKAFIERFLNHPAMALIPNDVPRG
jgi:hypothetical protein